MAPETMGAARALLAGAWERNLRNCFASGPAGDKGEGPIRLALGGEFALSGEGSARSEVGRGKMSEATSRRRLGRRLQR